MKKVMLMLVVSALTISVFSQGYKPGDEAIDFKLKNVDGQMVSLSDQPDSDGFIVIFTTNHCPYSIAYQERIIELDKAFKGNGYPVIAINPNDPVAFPADSFENMKVRAKEKGFTFPYLFDETQEVARAYGAERTPHVYILAREHNKLIVKYVGAIDDNYQDASRVKTHYVEEAVEALLDGTPVQVSHTKAIGCGIAWKR